jgi:tRNA modification GTPase
MPSTDVDTIAAIATAPGRGGIGVVRVSGKLAATIASGILGKLPQPRSATLRRFLDEKNDALDEGIALYFPSPHSYTGEDVLELQAHGGPAVLQMVLRRCLSLGARLAEPGEFSKRAFLNDKLDLAQAESVADLIDAASESAAKSALRSLQGEFSQRVHSLTDALIELRMLVEATLDFPEEEIDFLQRADAFGKLSAIQARLADVVNTARQGVLLRDGLQIVLIGQPNVGKSSLLNRLAGEEVAIVTAIPGTTRDTIRQSIEIEGIPLHIIDTAGLRVTQDEVEQMGIARTWAAIEKANLALLLIDASKGVVASDLEILEKMPINLPVLKVFNKIDLSGDAARQAEAGGETAIYLSAKSGQGMDLLHDHILRIAGWQPSGEGVFMARERHLRALSSADEHVTIASQSQGQLEFFAEELSLAQNALSSITGEFNADDLLGEIFSRFCIGK